MGRVHIIGCGKFGQRALDFYGSESTGASLVLVDSEAGNLAAARRILQKSGVEFSESQQDAVSYITALLADEKACSGDWIIPTVPLHLAFAVLCEVTGRKRLAWDDQPELPNFFSGERDEAYSSLADFLCPADCPQPRGYCYFTREPRRRSLLSRLANLKYIIEGKSLPSIILPSTQIGPGLGGFPLRRLARIILFVQNECSDPILFSTACRCHGVTNILASNAGTNPATQTGITAHQYDY